ncbi:unnamed protein product [Caenorhabditis brenneri]
MSVSKIVDLRNQIEQLLQWEGSKTKLEKAIVEMVQLYNKFDENILEEDFTNIYPLYDLTTHIFRLAKKEVEENQEKFDKHDTKIRTSLFQLSLKHLKICCKKPIDHNTIRYISYILTILDIQWVQLDKGMEMELSKFLVICSAASQLHWAEHLHVKTLWEFIWRRVEDPRIDDLILKNYVEMAVEILKHVDFVVFEDSVIGLVKTVMGTFMKTVELDHKSVWSHKRKYSVVYILSYTVRRWGLEARDYILQNIFDLTDYMLSLISVELTTGESKICMMHLVDDIIKLAMIDTVKSHRTISQKTEENVRNLVKTGIVESLKSASKNFQMSATFSISDEYIGYLARWFLVERRLDPQDSLEDSFDSTGSGGKKKELNELSLEGLIHLSFGANSLHKFRAWNGALQILNEMLKSQKLDSHVSEKILTVQWERRKSFQSETLRATFCQLLATVIPLDLRFGHRKIPSIDSILKYTLSLMPNLTSLPNAAFLTESILRYRSQMVPKGGLQLIWDTVSRTSPGSLEVLRLISALISFTEFDENSRFASDESVGSWSLRKDIIEWLLADPCANSHRLLYELCQFHPVFCYENETISNDDVLLQSLLDCKLMSLPKNTASKSQRPIEGNIQEIVNYVHDKLKSLLASEINLPSFVLSYEFSMKFPDVSFDFKRHVEQLYHILEDAEESDVIPVIQNFTEWPRSFKLPQKLMASQDVSMTLLHKNLHDQLLDLSGFQENAGEVIENIVKSSKKSPGILEKARKLMVFNGFVKNFIMENPGDPYQMTKRFEKYAFLLAHHNLLNVREMIIKRALKSLEDEAIGEPDMFIFEKLTSSALIRNIPKISGYHFDPTTVAMNADHFAFDERNLKIYLKALKKSPFLAQNIVRSVLGNSENMWHLHGKLLKMVVKNEPLLTACIATIPNMVRYLKVYQIQYRPDSKAVKFLDLSSESIASCQKYLRKPKENGDSMTPDHLTILFGCEKNTWKRLIFRFWKLAEKEPALVAERLFEFATESVELGLKHRLISMLQALTTSEFCRKTLQNSVLKMVFKLTFRSVFLLVIREDCTPDIPSYCSDLKLRNDLLRHRIGSVPSKNMKDFRSFEENMSYSVENFLKYGIESSSVDYLNFGLVEFYKQLNENLTEEAIKANEQRNIFIVDILSAVWHELPSMRPQIRPIVARFHHLSPPWTRFPQPPHTSATDEQSFLWKLRFHLTLKMMNAKKWQRGEFASYVMLLLTSYDESHFKTDLIDSRQMENLKMQTKKSVMCILSKILKRETAGGSEVEVMIDERLFEAITQSAAIFPDIATLTVPFLFKICVDIKQKFEFAMGKLLACLKGVQKEDEKVVYCLAECVDSIGLDVIARYERVELDASSQFGAHWYFVLARLFLKHGYLTHAFAIANILFDRLSSKKRNLMMIERIGVDGIEKSQEIIELLAEIYVAENNSIALSSLPPGVQNRPDVRHVMHTSLKEWLKLVASENLAPKDSTLIPWMCGLPCNSGDKYLDSILRCRFKEYPKHLDSTWKYVYFMLFHEQFGSPDLQKVYQDQIHQNPSIEEIRLMMIANRTADFAPESIEEHVILAVQDLRITVSWRENAQYQNALEVNKKTKRMVKLAELLTENHAYDAATLLLNSWEQECLLWKFPSIDTDLIRICKEFVTCQSGDPRTSEINLRSMEPRVKGMSDVAVAEWTMVLSKITIEYRNDMEEGIRILELGCRHLQLQNKSSLDARLKVLLKFHSVCVEQLSKLEEYLETRSFRMKKEVISVFEAQLQTSRMTRANSGDEGAQLKTRQRVRKEQQIEKADVEKVENLVLSAANKAVSSAFDALSCISQLDDDQEAIRLASLIVFPLIDIIYKYERDQGIIEHLKEHAKSRVPSNLWLCATSHLASKCFSVEKAPSKRYLSQILCHLIFDYPYHVLHTILMYEYEPNGSEVRGFLKNTFAVKTDRDVEKLKEIVYAMREAHAAYRELAYLDSKGDPRVKRMEVNGKTVLAWPKDLKIFKCKLHLLPIPTISQKIGRPGDLSTNNLITWKSHKDIFTIADGLSAPKIWEIQGSDGKWYKTVWKKDDVRQDVLVEQMFDVTNNMLEKRMLRTYNVVPLDTECGIIEFCGGTVSLKELLCGANRNGGLHQEFNPDEQNAAKVSIMMKQVQAESTETRRRVFRDICQEYSPVFRHFFYTQFPTAHIWRQKIIDYRQSLATWSVVCYMVGLGDRHASNILFDEKLCTFVHIDLGMILEYSKRTLPVPEQVPFRISRDVLDPILIEGIENGQLAEDCIQIMEKLKENGKVILGVASALLRQTMTNFKEAIEEQKNRPSYISEMAIGRLRDKLRGTDDGVTAQNSNLQIRRLLREATNADNLSRMFCGWMPFL